MKVVDSIFELIGKTPMLRLHKVTKGIDADVLLKLEYLNPSGSYKDRIALRMIESAEKAGLIKPGSTIVESSTGNTAIALAFVGSVKGYKVRIIFPEAILAKEKKKTLERFGAESEMVKLVETDVARKAGVFGLRVEIPGRLKCKELEKSPDIWWSRQYGNPDNVAAHNDLGMEIIEQTGGKVDAFVSSIGTGGNYLGVTEVLKREIPNVKCIVVMPEAWPGFVDPFRTPGYKWIPGLTDGIVKKIVDSGIADEIVSVSNEDAREMAYRLSREEGVFCGMSSGANVFVAINEAKKLGKGRKVVTTAVDSGDRYISDERFIT